MVCSGEVKKGRLKMGRSGQELPKHPGRAYTFTVIFHLCPWAPFYGGQLPKGTKNKQTNKQNIRNNILSAVKLLMALDSSGVRRSGGAELYVCCPAPRGSDAAAEPRP